MKIIIEKFETLDSLEAKNYKWDLAFYGIARDERGRSIIEFVKSHSRSCLKIEYDVVNFQLKIENAEVKNEQDYFSSLSELNILIESTTLSLNEILKLILFLNNLKTEILYIQPKDYSVEENSEISVFRNYNLSHSLLGFYPITERMTEISSNAKLKLVIILGYENYRIDRLFEHFELNPTKCQLICGLPAYNIGWELNTFTNNINTLIEKRISNNINYSDAINPFSIYTILEDIYQGLEKGEKMLIFPIGTKPHSIGTSLFLKRYADASIIYDHPIEIDERSKQIGDIYLYKSY